MKFPRLLPIVAFAVALCGCKPYSAPPPRVERSPLEKVAIPPHGAYTGAYIDFGTTEDDVTLEQIEEFETLVGKRQAIVASSSYWGEQTFPTANLQIVQRHGALPLIFWSPWDKPYEEDKGPDRFSLLAILDGKWDAYIDQWADGAKAFGHPFMVSFCNEMNGSWFPWSGIFYGGDEPLPAEPGQPTRYRGPETFKKAYRYVVDRVRARGAQNIIWVFHAMNYSIPQDTWNFVDEYYPGPDYVDWLGLSVYGQQFLKDPWSPFTPLLEWPYEELCKLDPTKPIMLTEWGIGEFPTKGSKGEYIREAFELMSNPEYSRLKAAIFWHERWQNSDGTYSNLRVNSSPESLEAYRKGVQSPFWLSAPLWQPLAPEQKKAGAQ